MTILSRVCAEFHDNTGAVLFTVNPGDLLKPLDNVPEGIRQDPLFDMLVADGSLDVVEKKEDLKRAENDPDKKPEKTETAGNAPAEAKASDGKTSGKK